VLLFAVVPLSSLFLEEDNHSGDNSEKSGSNRGSRVGEGGAVTGNGVLRSGGVTDTTGRGRDLTAGGGTVEGLSVGDLSVSDTVVAAGTEELLDDGVRSRRGVRVDSVGLCLNTVGAGLSGNTIDGDRGGGTSAGVRSCVGVELEARAGSDDLVGDTDLLVVQSGTGTLAVVNGERDGRSGISATGGAVESVGNNSGGAGSGEEGEEN